MKEITKLRKRAEAIGCRVRALRKPYKHHFTRKIIRYEFMDELGGLSASTLAELSDHLRRAETTFARIGKPNEILGRDVFFGAAAP
jgi:hypothetical protein